NSEARCRAEPKPLINVPPACVGRAVESEHPSTMLGAPRARQKKADATLLRGGPRSAEASRYDARYTRDPPRTGVASEPFDFVKGVPSNVEEGGYERPVRRGWLTNRAGG